MLHALLGQCRTLLVWNDARQGCPWSILWCQPLWVLMIFWCVALATVLWPNTNAGGVWLAAFKPVNYWKASFTRLPSDQLFITVWFKCWRRRGRLTTIRTNRSTINEISDGPDKWSVDDRARDHVTTNLFHEICHHRVGMCYLKAFFKKEILLIRATAVDEWRVVNRRIEAGR